MDRDHVVRKYAAFYRDVFLMLLSLIVTSVVLGVTIVFAAAGYLIDLSARHSDRGQEKAER